MVILCYGHWLPTWPFIGIGLPWLYVTLLHNAASLLLMTFWTWVVMA